jgi:co-chaperonin GroES (HSP10)
LKPRNTLVSVAEIKVAERKTAQGIVIPTNTEREYKMCEVIAVGPGMVTQPGETSLANDLAPGMVVLVKLIAARRLDQCSMGLEPVGIAFKLEDGRDIILVDQAQIVAIIGDVAGTA